jgi:VanZ family protein
MLVSFLLWLFYGLFIIYSSRKLSKSSMIFIISLCVAYGGMLEIMQATVFSNRSGDWFDFIANSFGLLYGLYGFL